MKKILLIGLGMVVGIILFCAPPTYATTTLLHEFVGGFNDGSNPFFGALTQSGSVLYGSTNSGGDYGLGVLYSVNTNGTGFTLLHEFAGGVNDGQNPQNGLVRSGSVLYGTAYQGGDDDRGVIFSINTNGTGFTLLHEFAGGVSDGSFPESSLVQVGSVLYGLTQYGGDTNAGTIFSINTDGSSYTILYEFAGGVSDGQNPHGSLAASGGVLYGMTETGGDSDMGIIFSINTDGSNFSSIYEFTGGTDNTAYPKGTLLASGTKLYGLSTYGGDGDIGVIFSLNTNGTGFTILHEFAGGGSDGSEPYGGPLAISGSTLYGNATYGGDTNAGVIFSIGIDGAGFTILHEFVGGGNDGANPYGGLLIDGSVMYGTTIYGGDSGNGTAYSLTLDSSGPTISLTALSPDPNSDNTPSVAGTAVDAGSTVGSVQFQMDGTGGSWTNCVANDGAFDEASDPFTCTSASLSDGSHTMYVRGTDSNSNMSANSSDVFTIDITGPAVNLTSLSPDPSSDNTPTFSGSVTDTYSLISSVQYQVDSTSGSWTACTASDGAFDEVSEAFSCTTSTLSQGSHTIYVRATDALSNTTSSGSYDSDVFTIDLDGPSLTLTAVSPDPTLNTKPVLTGTVVDGGLPIDYVQFQMDSTSGTWTDCTASDGAFDELSETFTCTIISALSEAEHVMYVRSADSSANSSQTSDTFTVDRTPSYINADFPGEGSYIRQQRPTFKFRASAGSISQFNSYTMSAQNTDGSGFTIANIPVNAPSIATTRYTITSSGYGDSNDDNDYIYITTASSPDWDSGSYDGRLKEGKNSWNMTAHESNGNTVSVGHSFYVDVTKPQISAITTSTLGLFEGYLLSTQTKPKVSFTLSDNLIPYKYAVDVYRQNYVLGIETGRTLVSSESIMPVLGSDQLTINLDFAPQQSLPYGKYLFIMTGYDKAENTSDIATLSLQLLSQEKAEELLKKPVKKDTKTLSLPELEKKAILRRQKEAQALEKLVQDIKKTTTNVDERVVKTASYIYQPLQNLATSTQKVLGALVDSLDDGLTTLVQFVKLPTLPIATSPSLEERIIAVRKGEHEDVVHGAPKMGLSTEKVEEQFKQRHAPTNQKLQEIFAAATTTLHGFQEPVEDIYDFGTRVKAGAETFYAIVFDKEPTHISKVTIEEIGTDYVTVSWETNHPATGKVNYGDTLSFGKEVQLTKYENTHTAKLQGLTPGKKYFFEVMSHGKNYTYDSFYTVETIIEEKE